jgi:predicted nucleic-acid-binding protein
MRLTVDTNVLVRALVQDDVKQGKLAARALRDAELIAVPLAVLCELALVLKRVYGFSRADIAAAIAGLANTGNVVVNRLAVDLGLQVLLAGGDFADGVIAFEGRGLGGETFVSFDREAVTLLRDQGLSVRQL